MTTIRYIIAALIAVILITVGFANHQPVELALLPDALDGFIGLNGLVGSITLPLFAVILISLAVGVVLGFFWEWVRARKTRSEASRARRDQAVMSAEVKRMKTRENSGKDEVLVLLEETDKAGRKAS